MAGSTTDAAHALDARPQGSSVEAPLHGMTTVKSDKIQVSPLEIQAQGCGPAQANRFLAPVYNPNSTGDKVILCKNPVVQLYCYMGRSILEKQDQGLSPIAVERRQPFQRIFSLSLLIAGIPQIRNMTPVGQLQFQGGQSEISHAAGRILLGQRIQ